MADRCNYSECRQIKNERNKTAAFHIYNSRLYSFTTSKSETAMSKLVLRKEPTQTNVWTDLRLPPDMSRP